MSHLTAQQQYYQRYQLQQQQQQQQQYQRAAAPASNTGYTNVANSYVPPASGAVGSYPHATGAYNDERSRTYLIPPVLGSPSQYQPQYAQSNIHAASSGSAYQTRSQNTLNTQNSAYANQQYYQRQQSQQQQPIITKNFYVHVAPEDPDDKVEPQYLHLGPKRKNYNIVFIQPPQPKQQIVPILPENEDKTIIYVFNKKPSVQHITIPTPKPKPAVKPDVFFIKYKEDAEAQLAQKKIQGKFLFHLEFFFSIVFICLCNE